MHHISQRAIIVALSLLFLTAVVSYNFPILTGRVVDQANLLDTQQEAELETKLKAYEDKTTNQIVVVTIKSLGGVSIEEYGVELGQHWGIGQKTKNNGVVLLIAPNERKMRIDVGYGLESTLTDAMCAIIIDRRLRPNFKNGDFVGGIKTGVDGIISVLSSDIPDDLQRTSSLSDIAGLIVPALYIIFLLVTFIFPITGKNTFIPATFFGVIGGFTTGIIATSLLAGLIAGIVLFALIYFRTRNGVETWVSHGGGISSRDPGFSGGGGSFGGGGASGSW